MQLTLSKLINGRSKITEKVWKKIYREDSYREQKGRCFYCLEPMKFSDCTADHVKPRKRYGQTTKKNIRASCADCNNLKNHMSAKAFMTLIRRKKHFNPEVRIAMAQFRYRLWSKVQKSEKKICKYAGIDESSNH